MMAFCKPFQASFYYLSLAAVLRSGFLVYMLCDYHVLREWVPPHTRRGSVAGGPGREVPGTVATVDVDNTGMDMLVETS
jgi:hypothetical protein